MLVTLTSSFVANAADWSGGNGNWNEWSVFSGKTDIDDDVFFTSTSAGATVAFTNLFYYGHYGVYHQLKFRNGLENPVVFTADTDEHGFKSDSTSSYARLSVGNGSDGSLTIDKGYYFFQKGVNIADSDGGNANGILTMRGGTLATTENGIKIGNNSGYAGTFDYYAGTINSEIKIGAASGSTGNFNVYGDLTLTNVLQAGNANSSTSSILVDGATLTLNAGLDVGRPSSSTASVVVTNGEINITSGNLCIARANDGYGGGNATANVAIKAGGKIIVAEILTGRDAGGVATFRVEEGGVAIITNSVSLAYGGGSTGIVEVAGGSFTVNKEFNFANGYSGPLARYVQTGGEASVLGEMRFCDRSSNTVVTEEEVHLNGGTLTTKGFAISGNTKTDNVYSISFDGGTLKPASSYNGTFIPSDTRLTVSVKENGGTVNTDGKNLTFASPILHGGTAETDGGIVKEGEGTLTLSGANTFTGDLEIKGGSVALASGASLAGGIVLNGGSLTTASAIANNITVKGGVLAYSSSLYTGTITLSGGKIDIDVSDYGTWDGNTKTYTISNVSGMTVNNVLASTGSNEVSASVEEVSGTSVTVKLHDAQRITVGQYVQLASTTNAWPSPETDYHNKCNSEDNGKRIGSSYQGSWFRVDLYNPTAGDYALEFKGGVKNATTRYIVTVTNATGYARSVTVSQRDTGDWTAEDDAYLILDNMPAGDLTLYFEVTYCSTSSYAGNYGYFKFTSIENMRTLTTGAVANASATVRRKSANNAATTTLLTPTAGGSYFILDGWNIVVEYTANDGYYLDGTSSFEYAVSGNIDMSSETLPEAKVSPALTIPARTYATATVFVDGVETAISEDGKYHFAPGSHIIVKYRGDKEGTPYGLREYDLGELSADYTLADALVPLYYRHEAEGTALWITEKLTGNRDVVLWSAYNTDFILDCDWSELTGTVQLEGTGNFKFGPNWKGAASSHWVANTGLYLYGRGEGDGSDSAIGGTLSFGTYVCTGQKRFYMFNGEQNLTMQFGGSDDFEFSANCGIGGYFWNGDAQANAGVKVVKTGTCKMTTNLAGAREWSIDQGEVEFVPLTATEVNGSDGRDMYVKLCTNMTVKAGATIGGFYGPKPELGLDGHGIEKLVFENGTTFKPNVGETWVVTNLTINGTLTVSPVKKGALVNGTKYTLLTAENGITGTLTDNVEDNFTVAIEDNSIVATYNGIGAWVVGNGETLVYSGAVTNGFATTSEGIIIENGGRMVVDCTAIVFPADGTLTLPSVQLPEGKTAAQCISVKAPSGTKGISFMATDGYGYWTFMTRDGRSAGFVIMIK